MHIEFKKILLLFLCFFPPICFSMEDNIDMDTAIQSLINVAKSNKINDTREFIKMWEQRNGNNLLPPHNSQNLLDVKDDQGNAPLHNAAYHENGLLVTWLLDRGANINAQNNGGFTPLHNLILQDDEDRVVPMMSFLLSKEAGPNIPNLQGKTCLSTALVKNRSTITFSLLVIFDAIIHPDESMEYITYRKEEIMKELYPEKTSTKLYPEKNLKEKLFSLLSTIPAPIYFIVLVVAFASCIKKWHT